MEKAELEEQYQKDLTAEIEKLEQKEAQEKEV